MKLKRITKIIFYTFTAAIPLLLWIVWEGRQLVFADFYSSLLTLGKSAGIAGICMFAGNLILSGRYRILDRAFSGLDQLYLFHRRNGIATFSLLSFHVLAMLSQQFQISFVSILQYAFDFTDMPVNYGRIAFGGLLIILTITLTMSGRLKYEILKKIHQFLGVFLFFGGLHAFFIPSDIAKNIYLRYYILTLAGVALVSYLWRTVLRKWLIRKIICDVVQVNLLGGGVTEVVMKPLDEKKIQFFPGQFIFVRFRQFGFPYEEHPFSLTASTQEGILRISAKQIGDFTKILPQLKTGAQAEIQGPFGGFSFLKTGIKNQIWIAGGIGVTPFMSMARTMRDRPQDFSQYMITMIYAVQTLEDFIFQKELEDIAQKNSNIVFIPWFTQEKGYLNLEKIKNLTEIQSKEIFLCGPKPMMFSLKKQFIIAGIPSWRIHFELFRLL